ncbi:hypothetical protein EMMF5_006160 [Cystobasidiomycetes sp. EMM_F5]
MATKNIAPGLAPTHQELDDSDEEKPTTTSFEEVEEKYPVTYTEEEEKRVVRKIDWRLLPIMMITYGLAYYDKVIMGQIQAGSGTGQPRLKLQQRFDDLQHLNKLSELRSGLRPPPATNIFSPMINYGLGMIKGPTTPGAWKAMFYFGGAITLGKRFPNATFPFKETDPSAKFLNERERDIAGERIRRNNGGSKSNKIIWPQVWEALRDPNVWALGFLAAGA